MAEGTTCLLGGTVAEERDDEPAYGIAYPGQVLRLGLTDIAGVEAQRICPACGRKLEVAHRVELPEARDYELDAALVS